MNSLEERNVAASDGTSLGYSIAGPAEGRVIVLCHGLAASGLQFMADADHFARGGYRVIVPDLRGHGRSGIPGGYGEAGFSIRRLADDLFDILDHEGAGAVHWVGNSLGGITALDMVARQPERFASLALFGTSFSLKLPAMSAPAFPLLYRVLGKGWLSELTAASTTRQSQGRALIAKMVAAFDPQVGRSITTHVRHYDLTAEALGYEGPVLILVGGQDRAVNMALKPALKRIGARPNWTVIQMPEGGHCANLDKPDAFRHALEGFWQDAHKADVSALP